MEILNAYDLTGSYRAAAELCGCSHHTVKKAVEDRDAGLPPATRRARMIDDWRDLLETWVSDSKGKIRGDKAHYKLVALGYTGTDRTTRRALAEINAQCRLGNTRVHRPSITDPGLWLQSDFADGPLVAGRRVPLLVARLPWRPNRLPHAPTFPDVKTAGALSVADLNSRGHAPAARSQVEMLPQDRSARHAVPDLPHTAALGVTRRLPGNTPVDAFDHCQYSLPA